MAIEQKPNVGSGSSITSVASGIDGKCILSENCEPTAIGSGVALKVRKPYTICKQREKWTEEEHQKFIEALKLYGRGWRQIEEYIGTKTAVQIRSHAQKFFSKVMEGVCGTEVSSEPVEIPPPRPKRKPLHPYPRKIVEAPSKTTQPPNHVENGTSINMKISERDAHSPISVLSPEGSQISTSHAKAKGNGSVSRTSSGYNLSHTVEKNTLIVINSTQMKEKENDQKISLTLNLSGPPRDDSTLLGADIIFKDDKSIKIEDHYSENEIKFVGGVPLKFIKLFGHTVVVANHSRHLDGMPINYQLMSSSILMGKRPDEKGGLKGVSCTGSKSSLFNEVKDEETNLNSVGSEMEYNRQVTVNPGSFKTGFYPYKRCTSDHESVYTADDRESQRIRVFS